MSLKITVDMGQVRQNVDNMIREAGPAKQFILQDSGAFLVKSARSRVHIITGRTQRSTKIVSVSGDTVECESAWGAPFEEDRGNPHDFITQALTDLQTEMPRIINNRMSKIFGGSIFR